MDTLFLFPTTNELQSVHRSHKSGVLYKTPSFDCICIGMGKREITIDSCYLPVIIGYAGALCPQLKTGDIVVSTHFITNDKELHLQQNNKFATEFVAHLNSIGIRSYHKSIYTASGIISQKKQKQNIYEQGASIVDMEGFWLAEKYPNLLSIRVILDTYEMHLPDFTNTIKGNGEISLANTFKHLLKYPHHIISLLKVFYLTTKIKPILKKCCYSMAAFRRS
ncbi:hypothetical protein [Candidatus Uabimicrobium sp. HlEnr_7]|uniref:phosphorylase family protein n=1 Tax=Candidatus Uabimicrobium helgolandensis TaxID=3095367 RepID=UPI0035591973